MSMPAYLGMPSFPEAAAGALADPQLRGNLSRATGTIRSKRAAAVAELADWAELRAAAKAIKDHTLANLDHYLTQLEERVIAAGGQTVQCCDAQGRVTGFGSEEGKPPHQLAALPVEKTGFFRRLMDGAEGKIGQS